MVEPGPYKSVKHWRAWVQPDGPNTEMVNLGDCINLDDISEPGGDISAISRCWRGDGGGWLIRGETTNPPDIVTVTITEEIEAAKSTLEAIKESSCPVPLYINGSHCPPLDVFTNWERTRSYNHAVLGPLTLANLVKKDEELFSTQGYALSIMPTGVWARAMTGGRQAVAELTAFNDVHFGNVPKCADDCGEAQDICTVGVACSDDPAGSPAVSGDVWYTQDSGANWVMCAAQPFAGAEAIISVVIFPINATDYRIVAARDADPAAAMEIAYSDDWGANWANVNIGAVVGLGANAEGALHLLDAYHLWLCLDTGYIYFSSDFGATWTHQAGGAGAPTANDLNEVWFQDGNNGMTVGNGDTVLITADGGLTWTLATATGGGNGLDCCGENGGGDIWWVGDDGGDLYYSDDHGTTWNQREFPGDGVGGVRDVEFVDTLHGFVLHDDAGPVGSIYRTRNGGMNWELQVDVVNDGLNSIHACTPNSVFAVGEVETGTAVVLKYSD